MLQMRVADFLVKPVQPVELVRTCARVVQAPSRAGADRGGDLHLSAGGRRRRRHHAGDPDRAAAAQQRRPKARPATCLVDLDFQHGACADYLDLEPRLELKRDRAAPGAPRPPAARGDDRLSLVRPRRDRGAEPAGRDALVRSRHGDAAARPRVVALQLCRDRHAAHLVLVDRQRAARLQPAVHRQRDDGAGPQARQAARRRHQRAAGRGPAARR